MKSSPPIRVLILKFIKQKNQGTSNLARTQKIVVLNWHEKSTINNQTDSRHLSEKSSIDEN